MREILRDVRAHGHLTFIKMLVLGLMLLTVYNVSSFSQSADAAIDRSFSSDAEVNLYGLVDAFLSDPDGFESFRESQSSLNSLADFYNRLDDGAELEFLSVFDQHMPVVNFRGGDVFDPNYGTGFEAREEYEDPVSGLLMREVTSFQLNEAAFDFYNIEVAEGSGVDWEAVDYSTRSVPVLLGHDYQGVYEIGDTLAVDYYFEQMDFEVVGFLEPDSSIYYKGDLNTFLDTAIVVPYPAHLEPVTDANMSFNGILYFAMINGDIAADRSLTADEVIGLIDAEASQAGFEDYALLNLPDYLIQLTYMRSLITDNMELLVALGVLVGVCVLFINGTLSGHVTRRRLRRYSMQWLIGHPWPRIARSNAALGALEYGVLGIGLVVVTSRMPNDAPMSAVTMLFALCVVGLIDVACQNRWIVHRLRGRGDREGTL